MLLTICYINTYYDVITHRLVGQSPLKCKQPHSKVTRAILFLCVFTTQHNARQRPFELLLKPLNPAEYVSQVKY